MGCAWLMVILVRHQPKSSNVPIKDPKIVPMWDMFEFSKHLKQA